MTDPVSPPSERRIEPRHAVRLAAKIVTGAGHALDATIVDRSLRGMRVRLTDGDFTPKDVSIVELASATIHDATVVWKSGTDFGVSLRASHSLRQVVGPEAERLRRIWRQAVGR